MMKKSLTKVRRLGNVMLSKNEGGRSSALPSSFSFIFHETPLKALLDGVSYFTGGTK